MTDLHGDPGSGPHRGPSDLLLHSRYRLVLLQGAVLLVLSFVTRLVLLAMHGVRVDSPGELAAALVAGEGYDLVATLWWLAPLVLYLALAPERWFRWRPQRVLLLAGLGLTLYGWLFVAAAEYFFFDEFDGRFNFVAVDYLLYPTEVIENIWQSYPTGSVLAAIAVLTAAVLFFGRRQLAAAWQRPARPVARIAFTAVFAVLLAGATWAVSPRWARVSDDRALNEVAKNGYYAFFGALWGSNASYEGLYRTAERPGEVYDRLRHLLDAPEVDGDSFAPGSVLRHVRADGEPRRWNVVVVLEESLGSEFIGALTPQEPEITPHFDRLAQQGTLLTHAFSTGNRTIRAIEATTASIPPLPGISIVRRPQSEGLFTLPALLGREGYQTLFVYGGRALFDGMGRYLRQNGVQRVVEQSDYPDDAFRTAWGVADEYIFDRALVEMDAMEATGKPFYTLVLSVSNHHPYDFPEDHVKTIPELHGRRNGVRYADWALGRFMEQAKRHAFFDHTLFVLMGDHGARVYGAAEIPLPSYEVPILFYAPGLVPAQRLDVMASSLDVPPTILGLLGFDYDSKFYGHDLFRTPPEAGRAFMTHNNEIALMRGDEMAVLGLHGSARVYRRRSAAGTGDEGAAWQEIPARGAEKELLDDAIAYFESADQLYRQGGLGLAGAGG